MFAARESQYVAQMWTALRNRSAAQRWQAIASNISRAVHDTLWDGSRGLYVDRQKGGGAFSSVAAVSGLLPLWLPDFPRARLAPLLAAIADPARFGTKVPLASVARSDKAFS